MLKIKAPIDLICHQDFLSSQDDFNERIRGNYGMLNSQITGEDLLHVVSTPPQLFLGEGGVTNLVSQANVENNQIQKVDIINNFINRILISADGELTYQDKVYITNILHQLGIRDEKKFMQEVYRLQEETENTVNLVNLYLNNMEELRYLVQEVKEEENRTEVTEEENTEVQDFHLYQSIYNRLQTGAIYQILQNYHRNESGARTVTNNEIRVIEQGRIAQNMLLQRLQNMARFENTPLIYRRENIYEGDQNEETEINETTVNRQLTSAVLLNLVDNLFLARYESSDHRLKNWYSFEDTFYQSSENTVQRIAENTQYLQYIQDQSREEMNFSLHRLEETHLLLQLLENRQTEEEVNQTFWETQRTEPVRSEQPSSGSEYHYQEGDTFQQTDIRYATEDRSREETTVQEETVQNIQQNLENIQQQNLIREQEYRTNLQNFIREVNKTREPGGKATTMRRSLEALTNPEQFMEQFKEESEADKKREKMIEEAAVRFLPAGRAGSVELIKEIIRHPERKELLRYLEPASEAQLIQEVQQTRLVEERREKERILEEHVTDRVTDRVTERVTEAARAAENRTESEERRRNVHMVHRSIENGVSEDIYEQLEEQKNLIKETTRRIEQTVRNEETKTTHVVNQVQDQQIVQQQAPNPEVIANMITKGIQGQVDRISDKVYNKLERRLTNEKIRRGF